MEKDTSVELAVLGEIAVVTLNQPRKLNALDPSAAEELLRVLERVETMNDVRVLLLTGRGRGFCAGVDLVSLDNIGTDCAFADVGELVGERFNPIVRRLTTMSVATLCYVNGVAAGAGVSFALACDFRVASPSARFVQAFSALGLAPDSGASFFLPRLVGHAKALELVALGESVSAVAACELGLVHWLAESTDGLEEALVHARRLARLPRKAICATRELFFSSHGSSLSEALDRERDRMRVLGGARDHREGLDALRAGREPAFVD